MDHYIREMIWTAIILLAEGAVSRAKRWAIGGRKEIPLSVSTPEPVRPGESFTVSTQTDFPVAMTRFEIAGDPAVRWEILTMRWGRAGILEGVPGEVFSPGSPSCERLELPVSWPGMTVTLTVRNAGDVPGKLTAVWWGVPLSHPHER